MIVTAAENIKPLVKWLNTSASELFRVRRRELAELLLKATKLAAPVRTGRLRDSLHIEYSPETGFRIMEGVEYGKHVRLGTRPHMIYPVNKRALWWPGAEHPVRYVNHPGTKPNPYHLKALKDFNIDRIAEAILDEFKKRDP